MFGWHPHSEPLPAALDYLPRLRVGNPSDQWLIHQLAKILLVETHQNAVGNHRERRVALRVRDQRLLAEGVADAELGQLEAAAIERGLARNQAFAADDRVEVVALGALLNDGLPGAAVHALHAHEDRLDVGRWDAV